MLVYYQTQFLPIKSACFNLAVKFSAVNLLNSWIVIYLAWSGVLFSTSLSFVLKAVVVTKPLVFFSQLP